MAKEIKLSQGKVALVSDEDFERVNAFKWTYHIGSHGRNKAYAVRNATVEGKRVWVRMHRFILDLPPGTVRSDQAVDHLNGDGLDNRRENLEIVSHAENSRRVRGARSEPFL